MSVCRNKNKSPKEHFPFKKNGKLAQSGYMHDNLNSYVFISREVNNFITPFI